MRRCCTDMCMDGRQVVACLPRKPSESIFRIDSVTKLSRSCGLARSVSGTTSHAAATSRACPSFAGSICSSLIVSVPMSTAMGFTRLANQDRTISLTQLHVSVARGPRPVEGGEWTPGDFARVEETQLPALRRRQETLSPLTPYRRGKLGSLGRSRGFDTFLLAPADNLPAPSAGADKRRFIGADRWPWPRRSADRANEPQFPLARAPCRTPDRPAA